MKQCPFCAEEINSEAIKCKHCGSMLNDGETIQDNINKKRAIKILTFEISEDGQQEMATEILKMKNNGWQEISRVNEVGKYKGGKGCCLFFIFAPLVLLAGHKKDQVIITFEKYVSEEEYKKETAEDERPENLNRVMGWVVVILVIIMVMLLINQ